MNSYPSEPLLETRSFAEEQAERAAIDLSARGPVLFLFAAAVFWLLVGTWLGFVSSLQSHNPDIFSGIFWYDFGRTWPAYVNVMFWGWAGNAGLGVCVWLLSRLCRREVSTPKLILVGSFFWNVALLFGVLAILGGGNTGVEGLEFPPAVAFLLFISYLFIAVWAFVTFFKRKPGVTYVSQWYLLAALLCLPWSYGTAQVLLFCQPVQGVMQAIVSNWFFQNLMGLGLVPIGLASAYYFIPKVLGRPVYSYYLAAFGFWSLLVFSGWTGTSKLIGGPVPMWISTVGSVANMLLLVPVIVVAINHHMTMKGHFNLLVTSPTLRFTVAGAMSYTAYSILSALASIRWVDEVTHFSFFHTGLLQLGIYAFFTMTMFGAMYYIVPRLAGCEWRSAFYIKVHFWGAFYGVVLMIIMLLLGGIIQGATLSSRSWDNWDIQFVASVWRAAPYLVARSIAWLLLAVSHGVFAYHFYLMLRRAGQPAGHPTLFDAPPRNRDMHAREGVLA
jgi:cytochrome c oxidase cbb3-type subunit 1